MVDIWDLASKFGLVAASPWNWTRLEPRYTARAKLPAHPGIMMKQLATIEA